MKSFFFDYIIKLMNENENIYFLTGDLGWPWVNEIKEKFPKRYIWCGASEQTMLDIAVGLSYSGKIPFIYTITPFLFRGFETIRTYISHECLNVKMIGVGREDEYSKEDGFSHFAGDDVVISELPNINAHWPNTEAGLKDVLDWEVKSKRPAYINIKR